MCCCSTASGPCSCSGEVGAPVRWSKSSRRTTEGCLHSACSKVSCSICLTVSARLPGKKINATRISMREHVTAHFRCLCSQSVCLPWSFLQSTISTCASRCCLALAQRARDSELFPLPCEETATRVKIPKTTSAHHIGSTNAQKMFLSV